MEIIRGDNKSVKFQRKTSQGAVIESVADEMFFTVKSSSTITSAKFQKKLSDGSLSFDESDFYYRFEILPEDTNGLSYGTYEYDIERISNGKKLTLTVGELAITKEITHAENEV